MQPVDYHNSWKIYIYIYRDTSNPPPIKIIPSPTFLCTIHQNAMANTSHQNTTSEASNKQDIRSIVQQAMNDYQRDDSVDTVHCFQGFMSTFLS
jgi:hypothetical protein